MDRTQRLLGAFPLWLIVAAVAGCSEASTYKAYTPAADPAPAAMAAGEAPDSPAEATSDVPGTPEATGETAVEASPLAAEQTVSPSDSAAGPDQPVTASRPEEIALAADSAAVTPAAASDPDGTLIAAVGSAAAVAAVAAEPLTPKLLVPEKSFKSEGDALRVSYDDIDLLKVLNMEPVTASAPNMFPQWLKDLEGQRIRIRGYMRPGELAEDLPFFVLARDTKDCCFGANSKSYDIIPVIMRDGVTTDYIHFRPFDVVGEFHIGVEMDFANPDRVEFMYRIEDAVVIYKE